MEWVKSSFSNGSGGNNCVEVAHERVSDTYHVRNSRHPEVRPLVFTSEEWTAFVAGVMAGEFRFTD
jgi:hypothetical protein